MARLCARSFWFTSLLAATACGTEGVQPSTDVGAPYSEGRMSWIGTASGGLPVRGSAQVAADACVEIAPTACLAPARAGRFCERSGGPWDLVVIDGEPVVATCYPPAADGEAVRIEGDAASLPADVDMATIVLAEDAVITGDVIVDGDHVSIYGEGTSQPRIDGDVYLRGRNARLRGLEVNGSVYVENDQAAIAFSRIRGDVDIAWADEETDGSILLGNDIVGQVTFRASLGVLAGNRVQGPFVVLGTDETCVDNLAFIDRNDDGVMDDGEVLGRLACEPGGLEDELR